MPNITIEANTELVEALAEMIQNLAYFTSHINAEINEVLNPPADKHINFDIDLSAYSGEFVKVIPAQQGRR